ncbi:MAG: TonB-dependent receptor [Opitutaceae bacterium]|nr:TonB-dependent receptor [Opitutaceae bacterium]
MTPRSALLALLGLTPALGASPLALEPVTVSAARAPQPPAHVPFSLTALGGDALRAAPTATLDGALRGVPGFSLFRRSDSLAANPTAQGVSLRGLGPSGASRSLVLLDGVPLNDPFGGWVAWSKIPRESLAGAELVRGGGATAWGNAALGGVVQLLTEPPGETPAGRLAVLGGAYSTRSAEFDAAQPAGRGVVQVAGRAFATAGFPLVAEGSRGPIDLAARSEHEWLSARWTAPVGPAARLVVSGRAYGERRGNGTPYQRNASREGFASAALHVRAGPGLEWSLLAYGQDQTFASTFSAVNAARTAETPASDQFAVPAVALGAAWSAVVTHAGGARTSGGIDYRRVRGETRENYSFAGGGFARQRIAGGAQDFAGAFALHERRLAPHWLLLAGGRVDCWRDSAGHRRELDRATGALLRDDRFAVLRGTEFSPSAGIVWEPGPGWRLRAAAQQSFRRPTLNELHRPFRAGSVITEANAALRTERAAGGELAAEWSLPFADGRPAPARATVGITLFAHTLRDAVGNVTVARGPGTFPLFGLIPAGGLGRQRLNLDRLRVRGFELSAAWQATPKLALHGALLSSDATVRRASAAPDLAGRRLAQSPRTSATLDAAWQTAPGLILTPRLRWLGRQFEDDENLLPLAATLVADLGVSRRLSSRTELFVTLENLGDARIETGRSPDGLVNTGTPRLALAGLRYGW